MILISFLMFITIQSSNIGTPLDQMNRTCVFGSLNSSEKLYFQYQIRFQKRENKISKKVWPSLYVASSHRDG